MQAFRKPSRILAALSLPLLLAAPAAATWSIVVVNRATGEVGIGSATCLANVMLKRTTGVVVVGKGVATAQAVIDLGGANRMTIFDSLMAGLDSEEILELLMTTDLAIQSHQYGIADLSGSAATWSGSSNLDFAGGVVGQAGPIHYAIQGNILTCEAVVTAAEEALVETRGDLGEKLMAAMQAAREFGGDGRCSCGTPPTCGCPPDDFEKSAHVAYLVIARFGDEDGICGGIIGCANGDYYMDLNVTESASDPDPVELLQEDFLEFQEAWRGHADHVLSRTRFLRHGLDASGGGGALLRIELADLFGDPLRAGGAQVSVSHHVQSAGMAAIGETVDHGDGTYSVPLSVRSIAPGTDVFEVVVEDGQGPVTLYPYPRLHVAEPAAAGRIVWEPRAHGAPFPAYWIGDPSSPADAPGATSGSAAVLMPLGRDLSRHLLLLGSGAWWSHGAVRIERAELSAPGPAWRAAF